jgi:hypothetical protein
VIYFGVYTFKSNYGSWPCLTYKNAYYNGLGATLYAGGYSTAAIFDCPGMNPYPLSNHSNYTCFDVSSFGDPGIRVPTTNGNSSGILSTAYAYNPYTSEQTTLPGINSMDVNVGFKVGDIPNRPMMADCSIRQPNYEPWISHEKGGATSGINVLYEDGSVSYYPANSWLYDPYDYTVGTWKYLELERLKGR